MASQARPPGLARSLQFLQTALLLGLVVRPAAAQTPTPPAPTAAPVPTLTQEMLDRATLRIEPGRHAAAVTRIAVGGDRVVTASEDRTVRIWDGATSELVRTLRPPGAAEGEEGRLYALALSPDGRLIAAAGATRFADDAEQRSASVYLFDAGTGELVRRLPGVPFGDGPHRIERVTFSPDGKRLAAIRVGIRSAGVYDVATGAALTAATGEPSGAGFGLGQYIDADFDGAGCLLLGQQDGHLTLYDAGLKRLVRLEGLGRILRARFAPDGKRVAVLYEDGRLELRRAPDLKPLAPLDSGQRGAQLAVLSWSPDGKSLWTAAQVGTPPQTVLRRFTPGPRKQPPTPPTPPSPPSEDRPLPGPRLTDLVALRQAILFGASDGSWGRIRYDGGAADDGTVQRSGSGPAPGAGPESLWVDTTGEEIELRLGPLQRDRLRFSVPALELKPATAEAPGLRPPLLEPPVPHRIAGWLHQGPVLLNDAAITARAEDPAALAVAPGREAFALGTAPRLLAFRFRRTADDGCPVRSPEGRAYVPCWSRAVPSPVRALNYSGDGRYAVALLADGTVRWYGAADGRERLILVAVPGDPRWLLVRPDGLYAASAGGAAWAGWQVNRPATATSEPGADFFPLTQLQRSHERPEAVARTLADPGSPWSPPPRPRLVREELPSLVTILDPLDGARASGATVTLRVAVRAPAGLPATLRVKLDGRPVSSSSPTAQARGVVGLAASEPPPRALPLPPGAQLVTLTVPVPARDCVIAVYAEGAAGAGPPALVRLRGPEGTAPPERPTLRVLAIGVGDYQRPALRLRYPAKDAADFVKLVAGQKGPGALYQAVETRLLTDREATRERILAGLDWLRQQAGAADTSLLFLAGHGINEPTTGEYFFLPVDADPGSAARSMLPAAALRELLASLPGRVVLLLDTCHSGNVLGRRAGGLPAPSPTALARERAISDLASVEGGVVVMAAATGSQASVEDAAWQNGAFTRALLEGLAGRADLRKTGRITVNMLDLYVSERVRELTAGSQTPATAKPSTIPDFPLLLSR